MLTHTEITPELAVLIRVWEHGNGRRNIRFQGKTAADKVREN